MAIKIFCDLCKEEIIDDAVWNFELEFINGKPFVVCPDVIDVSDSRIHLCQECFNLMEDFFKNNKGYK